MTDPFSLTQRIPTVRLPLTLELGDPVLAVGSCFAVNIGKKLQHYLFEAVINPHGTLYHPRSIANVLRDSRPTPELFLHDGLWRSLHHHKSLCRSDRAQTLGEMRRADVLTREALKKSRLLLVTLGSANVFALRSTLEVVSNCQRLPATLFERRRLEPQDCFEALADTLIAWLDGEARRQVILTVSPIRYLRDGAIENSRGKAALLLACARLERSHTRIHYFPAYEIVMDELRSYRYFERDLIRPTSLAVDIIWSRFCQSVLDGRSLEVLDELDKIHAAVSHRVSPDSRDSAPHVFKAMERIEKLSAREPRLIFDQILQALNAESA